MARSLAPIVIKSLEDKKKVLILCESEKQIKEVDSTLWSYGRNKFIPHATILDKDFDIPRQPVLITHNQENLSQADYLVFLTEPKTEFVEQFARAFYFYGESGGENAKQISKSLKPKNSFMKQDGKWIKA